MARVLIDGFELGAITTAPGWTSAGLTIESTEVASGAYSALATAGSYNEVTGLNYSTLFLKTRVKCNVTANPSGAKRQSILKVRTGAADIAMVEIAIATDGTQTLQVRNAVAGTTPISGISLTNNTWYCIEFKVVIHASTGILEVKLDGATTTASSQNTGSTNIAGVRLGNVSEADGSGTFTVKVDDFGIDDAAHLGQSKIICRQGRASSTPANNSWIKSDTGDASGDMEAVCGDTPLNTSTSATSTGANAAQTMVIHKFVEAQSGHGSETPFDDQLNSSETSVDTLNAVQAIINAKRSGGQSRTHNIRIKINTTDNDEAVSLTTSDLYYRSTFFSINTWDLSNGLQVGGLKAGSSGGQEMTINDIWVMAEYTPAVIDDPMVIIIE